MAFPQDRPVQMKLTTDTVMQSFLISALGGQIYAMPGMVTQLNLAADKVGHFDGNNTQYSGDGFHDQHFSAVAMSKDDFDAWLKQVQKDGVALNPMAYDRLAASSTPDAGARAVRQPGDAAACDLLQRRAVRPLQDGRDALPQRQADPRCGSARLGRLQREVFGLSEDA